ncbi:16S rRNA (adenine(1518)-N(6)/adenine(1519)-N(6))-dimethyltransferase [Siphonobacter sp. BAB-5385]|uniref:16S rRNA (adenine(1518)-N(6)/adenine(1519)-N(6))- dimethyltransferase RsmA n=1 Tax=unclassified Siphonobacter TaxID=2635712 RepID=UPI000B9E09D8|nr:MULTISPECIES: 16S rRNA (adenine(1518)-N(6)/adenine(1519)-N(6))-dimethyltransferase RsmA [unclassified Siphonobacter]OZI06425.1 16S rRNA (adenine(1518)-N(6)/adenine(1519)-N(6))-dimethyltransferase [Siphonobacter sp. BAB-5385]PMD98206.1 16S rRNA (adenine(1518)-N(6)/adenine(1519)-N(6))-dimethyltransferase [Siphonobacter sp. BAB-5405]
MKVKAKKHLGQHFLRDLHACERIADLLSGYQDYRTVLEIGPGMGVLTQFLLRKPQFEVHVVEIDRESVDYLHEHFPDLSPRVHNYDFLRWDLRTFSPESFGLIGNFPYNISSQIFFRVLEYRNQIPEVVCMLQKEVAQRIASPPGSRDYGILSVLLQAFYDIKYHFTVPPGAFDPPPKVQSGVIRLQRNAVTQLDCDEKLFFNVVKTAFNQRRKTLRNALKPIGVIFDHPLLEKRAEQLGVAEFVDITQTIERAKKA